MTALVMNADDFGMCHDVNLGIVAAFTAGILTQASLMVACPWFEEAVYSPKRHLIPVGLHLTATCQWDYYRWRPLTTGASLLRRDGTVHAPIEEAAARCVPAELEAEFAAQIDTALAGGLSLQHLEVHMGMVDAEVFSRICWRYDLISLASRAFMPGGRALSYLFTTDLGESSASVLYISAMDRGRKPELVRAYLAGLPADIQYNACHPAIDGSEIRSLTAATHSAHAWALNIRAFDRAVFTSPSIVALVDRLGIDMVTCGRLPPPLGPPHPAPVLHVRTRAREVD